MGAHYRSKQNFTWEALEAAKSGLESIYRQLKNLGTVVGLIDLEYQEKFSDSLADDFNTPKALAVLQEVFKSDLESRDKLATLLDFDRVLGLDLKKIINTTTDIPAEVLKLKDERDSARANKDWAESDRLREAIEKLGYVIEDSKEGTKVIKK